MNIYPICKSLIFFSVLRKRVIYALARIYKFLHFAVCIFACYLMLVIISNTHTTRICISVTKRCCIQGWKKTTWLRVCQMFFFSVTHTHIIIIIIIIKANDDDDRVKKNHFTQITSSNPLRDIYNIYRERASYKFGFKHFFLFSKYFLLLVKLCTHCGCV